MLLANEPIRWFPATWIRSGRLGTQHATVYADTCDDGRKQVGLKVGIGFDSTFVLTLLFALSIRADLKLQRFQTPYFDYQNHDLLNGSLFSAHL
jgi:hypothetical protein